MSVGLRGVIVVRETGLGGLRTEVLRALGPDEVMEE